MTDLQARILVALTFSETEFNSFVDTAATSYKHYFVRKENGGRRSIFHPAKATKAIQHCIKRIIFDEVAVHPSAMAYVKKMNSPLLTNAIAHKDSKYSVRIDFKDFFPSIGPQTLDLVWPQLGHTSKLEFEDRNFLEKILFVRYPRGNVGLAVGAPTSPAYSNIAMVQLDVSFSALANAIDGKSGYTRYSDDIIFSSTIPGACAKFLNGLKQILNETKLPKLILNEKKIFFGSRKRFRAVTGLVIGSAGTLGIGHRKKRDLRKAIYRAIKGELEEIELNSLRGFLCFVSDVEPGLINRLSLKYGPDNVSEIMGRSTT